MLNSTFTGDAFDPNVVGWVSEEQRSPIFGMIRSRSKVQYPSTLLVRAYFIVCLTVFYIKSHDPMFMVLLAIVVLGVTLTSASYLLDRLEVRQATNAP